jgi:hypothetical protein
MIRQVQERSNMGGTMMEAARPVKQPNGRKIDIYPVG